MKKCIFLPVFIFAILMSAVSQNTNGIVVNKTPDVKLSSGSLHRVLNFPSQFIKPRPVDVWLPDNYSNKQDYAVIYMHDGQMLFDSTQTWNKQEWKVDEISTRLMREGQTKNFIVVGIWNITELRNSNYFPQKVYNSMLKKDQDSLFSNGEKLNWINSINSDEYLKFIVKELKPYIDETYSTLKDASNTSILGSSRGGLISMYAICEYPQIFGAAACLSTHWIGTYTNEQNDIPFAFMEYMKLNLPDSKTHRIYFDYGDQTLDALYLPFQDEITTVLNEKKYFINEFFEGADHSENSWNSRLHIPITYLLKNDKQ